MPDRDDPGDSARDARDALDDPEVLPAGHASGARREELAREGEASEALTGDDDLPVVARLVVEIRSDGRRTVARGALEDIEGNRVAVRARGDSPWQLAWQLARSLTATPRRHARSAVRALLPGLPGRRRRG